MDMDYAGYTGERNGPGGLMVIGGKRWGWVQLKVRAANLS